MVTSCPINPDLYSPKSSPNKGRLILLKMLSLFSAHVISGSSAPTRPGDNSAIPSCNGRLLQIVSLVCRRVYKLELTNESCCRRQSRRGMMILPKSMNKIL
ncbi:hypothetical protein PoB_001926100 [Plakobranchus ocellatus]|uniref:Uncharacterized protein n=1 Tax=Plakobranchus ocellatus TaxID=259542 RepID=A0AAV3ZDP3_9GAST|nr:hypothetical protein PoB_001926100 [Plakobranchus ocellatus]